MCENCGCGGNDPSGHSRTHSHPHPHDHPERRVIEVEQPLLAKNDRLAGRNRGYFNAKGMLALNLLSSPGAGKTALIERMLDDLREDVRAAVIVGDLATDNDARRMQGKGAPVRQIVTGTVCHLDAGMVARALEQLPLDGVRLLLIENVGNLVCPASYDLGEHLRVVLLSVTEGEDKPLKYPAAFRSAHAVLITKSDLAEAAGFDREAARANIRAASPEAAVFELSARSGQGLEAWCAFLRKRL